MTAKFYATIEILSGQKAAILALTDAAGELVCAGRIETSCGSGCAHNVHDSLYELGYTYALKTAAFKGGQIETYRKVAP